jgi:hypothetical protein
MSLSSLHRAAWAALTAGLLTCASNVMAQPAAASSGDGASGRYNVPPPAGYSADTQRDDDSDTARAADERYAYQAEQWAAENCMEQRANSTAAGTVIGGLLGAIAGSGLAGRGSHAAGAVVGGAAGAVAGGAIGRSSSPDCPPGYALRASPPAFDPGPVYPDVVYVQPTWYDPWIWYGGHWIYRPYPYHRFWFRHRGFHP